LLKNREVKSIVDRRIKCPSCGSSILKNLGNLIYKQNLQSGTQKGNFPAAVPNSSVSLFKCCSCYLYFKYPIFSKEELNSYYREEVNIERWSYSLKDRIDWQLAIDFIEKFVQSGRILDVGAWTGDFLKHLGERVRCVELYGVEINPKAANIATEKGINIICDDFFEIDKINLKFHVVVAFDVIEHVENPLKFLASIVKITEDGGYIIVSTGNTEIFEAKLLRGKYYYYNYPEHLSFMNIKWFKFAAEKLNLKIVKLIRFRKILNVSLKRQFVNFGLIVLFSISPNFIPLIRKILRNTGYLLPTSFFSKVVDNFLSPYLDELFPPVWNISKDHIFLILKKIG